MAGSEATVTTGRPPNLLPFDGEAYLFEDVVAKPDAVMAQLVDLVDWEARTARIMGREVALPRLTAWYGDRGYAYSGITNPPRPWLPELLRLKALVEPLAGVAFDSVLLNLYRNGSDSVSWHRDAEPSLGPDPIIASVSLGAPRRFRLRHRERKDGGVALILPSGSCLVMGSGCQRHWLHALPKTRTEIGPRLNLTFRKIVVTNGARA